MASMATIFPPATVKPMIDDRPPARSHDDAGGAVHERGPDERREPRVRERLTGHRGGALQHHGRRGTDGHRRRIAARCRGRAPRRARRSRPPAPPRRRRRRRRAAAPGRGRAPVAAPCTRRRARLASCRTAVGRASDDVGDLVEGHARTCRAARTRARSAGASISSTTCSARPTESASSASYSGSIPSARGSRSDRARARRAVPRVARCGSAACRDTGGRRRWSATRRGSRRRWCRRGSAAATLPGRHRRPRSSSRASGSRPPGGGAGPARTAPPATRVRPSVTPLRCRPLSGSPCNDERNPAGVTAGPATDSPRDPRRPLQRCRRCTARSRAASRRRR